MSMNSKQINIDLTEESSTEIDRIREQDGLSTADIFRHSFALLRLYLDAKRTGREMRIVDPADGRQICRIELPEAESKPLPPHKSTLPDYAAGAFMTIMILIILHSLYVIKNL